ncbi:Transcriptional regulator, LuxR family protein [Sandaracinus amylolyticus]|uniref:Transcriptional regulator, LuxR family protein n=1 Tax=Sandaracinus amylolyticus TaxID=927083 RepID=A0A0F6SGM7_9BACT|nr:Transcriptional regulator, LuxR family protein [Sandaracinus amylolyticus]
MLTHVESAPRRRDALTHGLAVGPLGDPDRHVPWDDFVELVERIEADLGGPDALVAYAERFTAMSPLARGLASGVANERERLRVMSDVAMTSFASHVSCRLEDRGSELLLTYEHADSYRSSAAFWRIVLGGTRAAIPPRFPQAIRCEHEIDGATLRVRAFPRPAHRPPTPEVALRALVTELLARSRDAARPAGGEDHEARAARAASAWGLTPRESEALALIAAGASNKDIAARWGRSISVVELHVSSVLRKAGAPSRTALIAQLLRM